MGFILKVLIMIGAWCGTWLVSAVIAICTVEMENDEYGRITDESMKRMLTVMTFIEALVAAVAIMLLCA